MFSNNDQTSSYLSNNKKIKLPLTTEEFLSEIQKEYDRAVEAGDKDIREKQYRLAWTLIHCEDTSKIPLGLEMSKTLLENENDKREAKYYLAVALYRLKRKVEARKYVKEILEEWPEFRQAESLKSAIDEEIIREGLMGMGAALATAGVAVIGILSIMLKK